MKNRFREIFYYSRRQRRSLLVLYLLILLLILLQAYLRMYHPVRDMDMASYKQFIREWQREDSLAANKPTEIPLFPFDPNTVNDSTLKLLGFDNRLRQNLLKYRQSGGEFHAVKDLARLYGMDSSFYRKIIPWVEIAGLGDNDYLREPEKSGPLQISDSININEVTEEELYQIGLVKSEVRSILSFRNKYRPFRSADDLYEVYNLDSSRANQMVPYVYIEDLNSDKAYESIVVKLDINHADSVSLLTLPGVGPYYAGRIVSYRKRLGGYCRIEQLREVSGIDSLMIAQLRGHLRLDSSAVRKININLAGYEEMVRHPYLWPGAVRNILRFREQYREYQSTDELMNLELIDAVLFSKIAGYLSVEAEPNN